MSHPTPSPPTTPQWAPVFDMLRRLSLGSLVVAVPPGHQNMITFSISVVALIVTRETQIYYDTSTDMLAYVASIQILLSVVALIAQDANAMIDSPAGTESPRSNFSVQSTLRDSSSSHQRSGGCRRNLELKTEWG